MTWTTTGGGSTTEDPRRRRRLRGGGGHGRGWRHPQRQARPAVRRRIGRAGPARFRRQPRRPRGREAGQKDRHRRDHHASSEHLGLLVQQLAGAH